GGAGGRPARVLDVAGGGIPGLHGATLAALGGGGRDRGGVAGRGRAVAAAASVVRGAPRAAPARGLVAGEAGAAAGAAAGGVDRPARDRNSGLSAVSPRNFSYRPTVTHLPDPGAGAQRGRRCRTAANRATRPGRRGAAPGGELP